VPFYRDSGRLAPLFGAGDRFDMAGWADVPVLTRAEANAQAQALTAETVPPEMRPLVEDCTSGSTGTPLRFRRTELSRIAAEALLARAVTWHTPGVTGRGVGRIVMSRFVEAEPPPAAGSGPLTLPVRWPGAKQADFIARHRPGLVVTYPNLVLGWLEAAGPEVLASVDLLVLTGEILRPETRARIGRVFKGKLIEAYSTSEIGPIAFEAPDGILRLCEENVFVEGPEPRRQRTRPQPVVATPFYAYATPLIRYAPGDYATFAPAPSATTPGLRGLTEVLGRERNLFRRRDGSGFWPSMSAKSLSKIVAYRDWQLIQEDFDRFVLRIVLVDEAGGPETVALLAAHVRDTVGGGRVTVEPVAAIGDDRAAGKAYESYVCRLAAPPA
jgi:phenylacetate-CoA ligase